MTLQESISKFPSQSAICALLGDENDKKCNFYIANNDAQSSSLFEFGSEMNHKGLMMTSSLELSMKRLDSLLERSNLEQGSHWVVDVQGAEFQVLEGSGRLIDNAYSLEVEVSTRDEYMNGTKFEELNRFLNRKGFFALWKPKGNSHEDLLYLRRN